MMQGRPASEEPADGARLSAVARGAAAPEASDRGAVAADRAGRTERRIRSASIRTSTSSARDRSGARRVPRAGAAHPGRLRELPQARARARRPRPSAAAARSSARELVPALDNLERALLAAGDRPRSAGRRRRGRDARGARAGRRCSSTASCDRPLERAGVEAYDPAGERFDPELARGAVDAARRRAPSPAPCSRRSRRATGSTARCCGPPAWSSASRSGDGARLLRGARGRQEGLGGRDQEGVPQARAREPPRPQPRRRRRPRSASRRSRGLRHPLGSREAQAVRRRRDVRRLRPRRRAGGPAAAASPPTSATSSRPSSAAAAAAASRVRGRDLETEVRLSFEQAMDGRPDPGRRSPKRATCTTCGGSGAKPGTAPDGLPALRRPRGRRAEPGASSRSASPARGAAGRARSSRSPARPAKAAGSPRSASATGSTSPPASATAAASGSPARARTGRAAVRLATST